MTHMRYWAMSLAAAVGGGFIAIERFAFAPTAAVWIAFGVAIAVLVFSLAALGVALARENHAFSGLSAATALIAGWTIIAMRTFATPAALWLAFAGGVTVLLLSLRALALHETTIERVVHALELGGLREPARASSPVAVTSPTADGPRPRIGDAMRSWMYWLTHMGIALAGALVVLLTFALTSGAHHASPRWIAFGIGIAALFVAVGSLVGRGLAHDTTGEGTKPGRRPAIVVTTASAVVAIALIVTMAVLSGSTARWLAFALGLGLVGVSLLASLIHELTSERVRHELEIAQAPTAPGERVMQTS